MTSLAEMKDLVKVALGTPETVNFKALHKALVAIIQRLIVLGGKNLDQDSDKVRLDLYPFLDPVN